MNNPKIYYVNGKQLKRLLNITDSAEEETQEYHAKPADEYDGLAKVSSDIAEMYTSLGKCGDNKDEYLKVFSNLEIQAKSGALAALFIVGSSLLEGFEHVAKDELQGLEYLQRAAELGFSNAQVLVGYYYQFTARQPKRALPYVFAAAKQNNPRGQVLYSDILEKGIDGVLDPDALESLRYLRKAAESQHGTQFYIGLARSILADRYTQGKGVGKNLSEAMRWHRLALESGYSDSRMPLIHVLTEVDAVGNKAEIDKLLAQATQDGNASAHTFTANTEWKEKHGTWRSGQYSIEFWLKRAVFLGTETRSSTSVRSAPVINGQGGGVYTITNNWNVLYFRDSRGYEFTITPEGSISGFVLGPGQEVEVLYAGATKENDNATGYPYRIFKLGTNESAEVSPIKTLREKCAIKNPTQIGIWVWGVLGLVGLFAGSGITSFIGLCALGFFAYILYKDSTKKIDHIGSLEAHYANVIQWVNKYGLARLD